MNWQDWYTDTMSIYRVQEIMASKIRDPSKRSVKTVPVLDDF